MVNAIEAAKTDDKIEGISILNNQSQLGLAQSKAVRDKLEEFKKLWIAGGGHFSHFSYLPKEGAWSISSAGLPESVYPLLLNSLVTLNTAWVFYLGAWSKCEALARKEKNGLESKVNA